MIVKNGDLILSPKNTDSKGSSHNERKTNWPSCKARELGTSLFRHASLRHMHVACVQARPLGSALVRIRKQKL